ncbi:hypothetical protein L1987_70040 [Smallanthus sonchifolius]|uniref:Uncharacterized protein n=1 Tax=Smallanthus sonchifolius TaxID=185202 RepID=A0ACB9AP66_9ASTR|nr:hypothetical protein L1987_70040 [Smallanthus sonchifolius]
MALCVYESGGRDYFWVGCESLWVRYWGRDGKGWGANLANFLSSDESRYGEVGSNVIFWGGGYKGWARYCWISLTKVHWKGVWSYKFVHHYLIWWKVTMDSCRNYHSDCRVAHMMALGWYNWMALFWCFHILQNGNCFWGLFGWACWHKGEMIRFGITSGVELNLEGRADCKLGLAWCNAQGDKWLMDWSTYNDPARMLWCLLGHGENLMELALNLYFWTWIESPHHHTKVSLEDSQHGLGSDDMSGALKHSMGAVEICSAKKSASAGGTCSPGLSVSGSSSSPVIQPKLVENVLGSGSSKETSGFGYAGNTGSTPPAIPLFSSAFKAMLSRTYLTTVLSRGSLSGEGNSGHGLWGAMNRKAQTQVAVGPMNMSVADPVINLHEQEGVSQEEVVNNMHADDLVVGQEDGAAFHANIDAGVVSNMEQTNTGHGSKPGCLGNEGKKKDMDHIEWNMLILKPTKILWPEVWSDNSELDLENLKWSKVIEKSSADRIKEDESMGDPGKNKSRKQVKIWYYRNRNWNRNPEKNLKSKKVTFKNDFIPRSIHHSTLGFSAFRMGKASKNGEGTSKPNRKPIGEFYQEAAIIEENLTEIASNINTTDVNTKLVTSISNMTNSKVKVWYQRVDGMEEKFVNTENNEEQELDMKAKHDRNLNNLTAIVGNGSADNDGFVLVRRRKGGANMGQERYSESYGAREDQGGHEVHPNNSNTGTGMGKHGNDHQRNRGDRRGGTNRNNAPGISVVETSYSFGLLDKDGNEMGNDMGDKEIQNTEENMTTGTNKGWIKRQERTLNTKFSGELNQEQFCMVLVCVGFSSLI